MSAPSDISLLLAGAATTITGTAFAWLLQGWQARRERRWALEDRAAAEVHEARISDRETGEARFQRLRAERREVYTKVLDAVAESVSALHDFRDADVPDLTGVKTLVDIEASHPIGARAVRAITQQRRLDSDVILIADSEVRDSILLLSKNWEKPS